jgi:ribosomal protein L37AE/L43A
LAAKAEKDYATRKTETAKCSVLYAAWDKIAELFFETAPVFSYEYDTTIRKKRRAFLDCLENKLKASTLKEIRATCDACGNAPRNLARIESGQWVCRTCAREIRAS